MRVRDRQRRAEGIFRLARRILWQAYYNFDKDNGWMMAGHIAYMGLFALFPFLIFLVALAGFLGQGEAADNSVELGLELLPTDVASALKPAIDEVRRAPHAGLMTFGILATLWASSSGLEALRHALNLAYAVADQPAFWRTRLESLLLTILAAIVVIVVMVLLGRDPAGARHDPDRVPPAGRHRTATGLLLAARARPWASCCCSAS